MSSRGPEPSEEGAPEPAESLVALVASAGGVHAVGRVLESLPVGVPAAVIVLLHLMAERPSHLAPVLARTTALPVGQAEEGDLLEAGRVYVAPPDAHLVVRPSGRLALDHGPVVRYVRPAADVLLASCATAYAQRALAVVLTGMGSDGAVGAAALHAAGGTVIAQDAASAEFPGMPGAAVAGGGVDSVLPLEAVAAAVVDFAAAVRERA